MSTPIFDNEEKQKILSLICKLEAVEREIISKGFRTSHISGQLKEIPKIPLKKKVVCLLLGEGELLPSPSFVETVKQLIVNNVFVGIDCTSQHYLNKAWEIYKVLSYIPANEKKGISALNIGGASTLINFYLARCGIDVTSIDLDWRKNGIVENEKRIAQALNFNIKSFNKDFFDYNDKEKFDFVFSICVIEHLDSRDLQVKFIEQMKKFVHTGGYLLLTFGYGPRATDNPFKNKKDVEKYISQPLSDFLIVEPFTFNGVWTISERHTWGFIAARK